MIRKSSISEISTGKATAIPGWIRVVLKAAAIYNLLWGGLCVLMPETTLGFLGVEPQPIVPQLWQCIGMIVGVYGIGYAIAARNPYVHWPIILVGLLGKVFGPIGFAWSVYQGTIPSAFGWTILTNDLMWWIPFVMMLWRAAVFHQSQANQLILSAPIQKIDPLSRMLSQKGASLDEISRRNPVLLVFLRHSGCPFCKQAIADLAAAREQIEENGTRIAFVHMGRTEPTDLLLKNNMEDVHTFRDPSCSLYDAFGLQVGSFWQLLGPSVLSKGIGAWMKGHSSGPIDGNAFRMPGVFLLHDGHLLRAYKHTSSADRPNYAELATPPEERASDAETSFRTVGAGAASAVAN